jgi:hypothetical protein
VGVICTCKIGKVHVHLAVLKTFEIDTGQLFREG